MTSKVAKRISGELLKKQKKEMYQKKEWYTIRALLGNRWAFFYILVGGRERGKSYSVMKFFLEEYKKYGKTFTWIRLTEASAKKLTAENGRKFIDPDLVRNFNLKLSSKGTGIYDDGKLISNVLALSTAFNDKGSALFDNENTLGLNIALDEFQFERGQKRTFDIMYNLVVQLENLCRSSKNKIRIFMIGNTTEEASDILAAFNFIPEKFGVYKLKKKRCVIDYIDNSEAYVERRKGSVGDILAGHTSNYTNTIESDTSDICKKKHRLIKPLMIIKFTKDKADWFTVWDGNIIAQYNRENKPAVPMVMHLDETYKIETVNQIIDIYNAKAFLYKDLITKKRFRYHMMALKKK